MFNSSNNNMMHLNIRVPIWVAVCLMKGVHPCCAHHNYSKNDINIYSLYSSYRWWVSGTNISSLVEYILNEMKCLVWSHLEKLFNVQLLLLKSKIQGSFYQNYWKNGSLFCVIFIWKYPSVLEWGISQTQKKIYLWNEIWKI